MPRGSINESHGGSDAAAPTDPTERLQLVDALRGFALLGILIVNLQDFSLYWALTPEQKALLPTAGTDRTAHFLHFMLGFGKFNTIFSFLFGLGFAMFLARAPERDAEFRRLYRRRLTVLLAIGAAHLTFLWYGDIVALYAALGFVLILFRRVGDRALLTWATFFILSHPLLTSVIVLSGGALDPGEPFRRFSDWLYTDIFGLAAGSHFAVASSGSWIDFLKYNVSGPPYRIGDLLSSSRCQRVLGIFLVGLWAGRRMIFANPVAHRQLFRRVLFWGLPIGLLGNAIFAPMQMATNEPSITRDVVYAVSVVPLAMAYLAGLSLLWTRPGARRWLVVLAPAGRAALTVYLSQTVIGLAIFCGVGLGFGGRVGPTFFVPIAVVIFALQVALSVWWLQYFRFGPFEWVWRSLTYGRREPLRRAPAIGRAVAAAHPQA